MVLIPSSLPTALTKAVTESIGISEADTVAEVLAIPTAMLDQSIASMQVTQEDGATHAPKPMEMGKVKHVFDKARTQYAPRSGQAESKSVLPLAIMDAPPPGHALPPTRSHARHLGRAR